MHPPCGSFLSMTRCNGPRQERTCLDLYTISAWLFQSESELLMVPQGHGAKVATLHPTIGQPGRKSRIPITTSGYTDGQQNRPVEIRWHRQVWISYGLPSFRMSYARTS